MVKFLIEHKADPNLQDVCGNTALLVCAIRKHWNQEIFEFLLENGANPEIADFNGVSLMHILANNGNIEGILMYLNKFNVSFDKKDNNGETILMWAAYGNDLKTVKLLVENGADITAKNAKGEDAYSMSTNPDIRHFLKKERYASLKNIINRDARGIAMLVPTILKAILEASG